MNRSALWLCLAAVAVARPAGAVTPPSPDIDVKSMTACAEGSMLKDARVGPPVHFSNRTGFDIRLVTGAYPQPSKKGARAAMLCIYHRRSGGAEVVPADGWLPNRMAAAAAGTQPAAIAAEAPEPQNGGGSIIIVETPTRAAKADKAPAGAAPTVAPPAATVSVAEYVWRAKAIDGKPALGAVTLRFGPRGTVVGKTGCNSFTAAYELNGDRLRVRPPFDMGEETCSPELTAQETRVQEILFLARSISQASPTQMTVEASGGRSITFVRDES